MDAADHVSLFDESKPFASSAVWACAVYSLLPFIGVVFVPFIFVFGVVGLVRGEQTWRAMAAGVLILMIQLVLWWLMYVVPKWGLQV
jgi:NADH:ubiquinone oxidoreductase subunit 6 (subunit J)